MMDGKCKRYKLCPKGHALGEVVRVEVRGINGRKRYATRLKLYRNAVEPGNGHVGIVVAVLEGTAPMLLCDLCASKSQWVIGAEALGHLLEGVGA